MKTINWLMILVISLFTIKSSAQVQLTVTGTVKDDQGIALEFANITLKHIESEDLKGISTDIDGKFVLETKNSGPHELIVNYISYDEWKQEIDLTESMDIGVVSLTTVSNDLAEVIVTGEKVLIEKRKDKLVFNVEQSPMSKGYDGIEVLKRSPNIVINPQYGILMRNEPARVLINGKQTTLAGEDLSNYIQTIQSEDIKSIEVQTHQTTSTDAVATGGIVNIILKKKPIGFDGIVRTSMGLQANEKYKSTSGLNLNYGAEKWNLYGGFNITHQLDQSAETFDIDYNITKEIYKSASTWDYIKRRNNYNIGMVFDLAPKHTIGVELAGVNSKKDVLYVGNLTLNNSDSLLLKGGYVTDGVITNKLQNSTLNYTWKTDSKGGNLKLYVDYTTQDLSIDQQVESQYTFGNAEGGANRNVTTALTDIYFVQTDFEKTLVNDIELHTGLKYTQIERENAFDAFFRSGDEWNSIVENSSAINFKEKISAGFITLSKKIKEKNFVKIGLRVENTDLISLDNLDGSEVRQNYTDFFPSLFASHDFENGNILSFNFIKSLTRPNFEWLNNKVVKLNDFRYELGTPDLRPQYHYDFELSFRQKEQSFSAYYKVIDKAIFDFYTLTANNVYNYQYLNLGLQQETGIEYNRYGNLFDWWYLKASASVFYRQFNESPEVINFQAFGGYVNLTNSFQLSKTLNFDVTSWYYTNYELPYYLGLAPYQVDIMLQKKFLDNNLIVRFDVVDIFDIYSHRERRTYPENVSEFELKLMLRMVRLGVSYNFSSQGKVNKRKNDSKNEAKYRF